MTDPALKWRAEFGSSCGTVDCWSTSSGLQVRQAKQKAQPRAAEYESPARKCR